MSDEITWPVDGWQTVARARPEPGVIVTVGRLGVMLSIAAGVVAQLQWAAGALLELRAIETDDVVFLSLATEAGGALQLTTPPGCKAGVTPKRLMVRVGTCGGIALALRKGCEVKHRVDGGVLQLAVPRVGDSEADAPRAQKAAKPDAPAAPPPSPAAPASALHGLDILSAVKFVHDAAWKACPSKIDREDRKVRIAAAVALVTFGEHRDVVRPAFDLDNVLLPDLEDMPRPSRDAAQAALTALRDATDE